MELFVNLPVSGVKTSITDHFIVLFRNVLDEPLYEFHDRDGFLHVLVIFVSVVVESDKVTIIIPNCFLVPAETSYRQSAGKIGRSAYAHLLYFAS